MIAVYTKYEKRSPLTVELRRHLAGELEGEIDALSALLDRDLSHWYRVD